MPHLRLVHALAASAAVFACSSVVAVTSKSLSPAGQKAYDEKMATYPEFDSDKANKDFDEAFPQAQLGAEVTLSYMNGRKTAKGKYNGVVDGRFVQIGSTKILNDDLGRKDLLKYFPEENKKEREAYLRKKKNEYNAKLLEYRENLQMEIFQQYPIINSKEVALLFAKVGDKEKRAALIQEYTDFYYSKEPVKGTLDEFGAAVTDEFLKKHDELLLVDGRIWIKADREAYEKRLQELEAKRVARIADRILYPAAATPVFECDGGIFEPSKPFVISCPTLDAEIRYTLNGDEPNEDSPLYKEPITLNRPCKVMAKAFHPEYNDSDIAVTGAWAGGLYASYFEWMTFRGKTIEKIDPELDFEWGAKKPNEEFTADLISMIWAGQLIPKVGGEYTFFITADDGSRFWLGDSVLIDAWKEQAPTEYSQKVILEAGKKYDIKISLTEVCGIITMKFEWIPPGGKREFVPQEVLSPEGKYVEELRAWNKKQVVNGEVVYYNRSKMMNPGATMSGSYKLPIGGGQKRWDALKIK